MATLSPADSRLRRRATALAQLYAAGQLTLDQLRDQMAQEIRNALTAALLSGSERQRSPEIDAALMRLIDRDLAELDRLARLLGNRPEMTQQDVQRRLEAFADSLPEAQSEGERLTQNPVNPLVPAAIGAALLLLLGRIEQPGHTTLPRLDGGQTALASEELQRRMDELSEMFANKEILADEWFIRMQRELRVLHTALYQQGVGRELNADDLARIKTRVDAQLEFLNGFRDDLMAGKLTPEQVKARARMYLANGQASLQEGATARLGFILPAYPKDGSTICRTSDMCFWDIRQVEGGYDCSWRLRPAEHCETCENRAALWNPIEIRNGVLGPYSRVGTFA